MYEIEIKASADLSTIRGILKDISAEYHGVSRIVDTYYDTPSLLLEGRGEALRIRTYDDDTHFLIFKGKDSGTIEKTRKEYETRIDEGSMHAILFSLGYIKVGTVAKTREVYEFDNIHICLDSVDKIGDFIELEIVSQHKSKWVKEKLFDFADALGVKNFVKESYAELSQSKINRGGKYGHSR